MFQNITLKPMHQKKNLYTYQRIIYNIKHIKNLNKPMYQKL